MTLREIDRLTLTLKLVLRARIGALPRDAKSEVVRYFRDKRRMKWKEVAEVTGISLSYSHAIYRDPEGLIDKARKRRYGRPCLGCGRRTSGAWGPRKAPLYCVKCRNKSLSSRLSTSKGRKRWSDEECLNALRRVVANQGRAVSFLQYNDLRQSNDPEGQTLMHRWGSWRGVCRAAGVPNIYQNPRQYSRIGLEQCYAAYDLVSDALGHPATAKEYSRYRKDHPEAKLPSEATLRSRMPGRRWTSLIRQWMDLHGLIVPDREPEAVRS